MYADGRGSKNVHFASRLRTRSAAPPNRMPKRRIGKSTALSKQETWSGGASHDRWLVTATRRSETGPYTAGRKRLFTYNPSDSFMIDQQAPSPECVRDPSVPSSRVGDLCGNERVPTWSTFIFGGAIGSTAISPGRVPASRSATRRRSRTSRRWSRLRWTPRGAMGHRSRN